MVNESKWIDIMIPEIAPLAGPVTLGLAGKLKPRAEADKDKYGCLPPPTMLAPSLHGNENRRRCSIHTGYRCR